MSYDPLNTPMKKIQSLSIHSPDIKQIMLQKGYSNAISDKVLNDLNFKLNDITNVADIDDKFNQIHNKNFNQMESIINHYSMKRQGDNSNLNKKKRRTLTGIEELISSPSQERSPERMVRDGHDLGRGLGRDVAPVVPGLAGFLGLILSGPTRLSPGKVSPTKLSPTRQSRQPRQSRQSPTRAPKISPPKISAPKISPPKISPPKISAPTVSLAPTTSPKISPSKKSFDLNGMLNRKISIPRSPDKFKQPQTFQRIEPQIPKLQKKSSIPTLQKRPSNSSILSVKQPTLTKKSSIPTLQKKPSTASINSQSSMSSHRTIDSSSFAKPTISSSQKSLDRFTRFKNKFR